MESVLYGLVGSILTGLLAYILKLIMNFGKQLGFVKTGLMWTQHDRLLYSCKKYLNDGFIDADDLENLEGLYKSYKGLGGNGTITKLFERVQELPIR